MFTCLCYSLLKTQATNKWKSFATYYPWIKVYYPWRCLWFYRGDSAESILFSGGRGYSIVLFIFCSLHFDSRNFRLFMRSLISAMDLKSRKWKDVLSSFSVLIIRCRPLVVFAPAVFCRACKSIQFLGSSYMPWNWYFLEKLKRN